MDQTQLILDHYRTLMHDVDRKTEEVYTRAPEIPCRNKCFDCCLQLFPVSFAEAYYISEGFKKLDRETRRQQKRKAEKIQTKILAKNPSQCEKHAVDKKTALKTHKEFAVFLHQIKSHCPALDPKNPKGACTVYEFRNHDCRTMGFSFEALSMEEKEIIGCYRFESLKYLLPRLMDYNYRYHEKMQLDRALIKERTNSFFTENILYYTTMCGPLLKDYAEEDWSIFFNKKAVPSKTKEGEYYVVIDVEKTS